MLLLNSDDAENRSKVEVEPVMSTLQFSRRVYDVNAEDCDRNDFRPLKRQRLEDSARHLDEVKVHVGQADQNNGESDSGEPQDYTGVWGRPDSAGNEEEVLLVERGVKVFNRALTIFLRMEAGAHWLLTVRMGDVKQLIVLENEYHKLECHPVWKVGLARMDEVLCIVNSTGEAMDMGVDLVLLDGSVADVSLWIESLPPEVPVIFFWNYHLNRSTAGKHEGPQIRSADFHWVYVDHNQIGGVTNAKWTFGYRGLAEFSFAPCVLRSLRHIVKYSERPKPCLAEGPPRGAKAYDLNDRLDVRALDRPIFYQSRFSWTGYGIRQLIDSELADCFDLPLWMV